MFSFTCSFIYLHACLALNNEHFMENGITLKVYILVFFKLSNNHLKISYINYWHLYE